MEVLALGEQQEGGVVAPHPERGGGGWGSWVGANKGGGLRLWLVAGPSCSQKDSEEANIGRSSAKVLTGHALLVVGGFKLAPRSAIFKVHDLHCT